ncbi:MAG: hypothetical protein IKH12_10290 [Clostridia bacterium]|nr:hypothetical protein [Clostridia bacterium]
MDEFYSLTTTLKKDNCSLWEAVFVLCANVVAAPPNGRPRPEIYVKKAAPTGAAFC